MAAKEILECAEELDYYLELFDDDTPEEVCMPARKLLETIYREFPDHTPEEENKQEKRKELDTTEPDPDPDIPCEFPTEENAGEVISALLNIIREEKTRFDNITIYMNGMKNAITDIKWYIDNVKSKRED